MLVDTHILIWVLEGVQGRLGEETYRRLQKKSDKMVASAACLYEMALKERKGGLAVGATRRITGVLETQQVPVLDITPAHILNIPHGKDVSLDDPFDLLLVAQARTERLPLLTVDSGVLRLKLSGLQLLDGKK